jgi:microcin C transport system substrate-binding protein
VFRGDYTRLGSYFSGFGQYTNDAIRALPYSPEKARQCFAEAGYTEEGPDGILCKPDGTRLQVVVSSRIDPLYSNCMNILRE